MSRKDQKLVCQWIRPDREGQCPPLLPGQCCKDSVSGLWHFCTPENGRFAIYLPEDRYVHLLNKEGQLELGSSTPRYASERSGAYPNEWTVKAGIWKKIA